MLRHTAAIAALLGTVPISAAPYTGQVMHDTDIGQRATGVGALVGIKIKLGSDRVVKESDRVQLDLSAGPVLVMPDQRVQGGIRRGQSSFVGLELRPGYSTSLNFGGRPLFVDYTRLGAADKHDGDKDQGTGDKIAWVAAVAGVVMVGLVATYTIACGPGEDSSCGSD
jgi:hypothetical protein